MRQRTVAAANARANTIDELDFLDAPAAALQLARNSRKPVTILRYDGKVLGVLSVPGPRKKRRSAR